ncbi:malto-oligosyltrehalose trehalohydrolase [Amorphus orientalis]|uniref:Malto-oligosyltrehalose trehalohydrolase n=1 Tax=Amorphus orientalis TaxID=649198 RepID=A0AAE4AVA2_9HYPH|nr:malto-oligosyltrehalose trehalohydrolase [Amorphus orientalis]MDQ0316484.1 malto-oligosyltrehalose trehalohydrolase [Amorphus orientalis]
MTADSRDDRRRFEKTWGAELLAEGGARFRLWAPGETQVAVRLDDTTEAPMTPGDDGWFELVLQDARPGDHYAFVLGDGFTVPDPAARAQAGDVHGPSVIVDPGAHRWAHPEWTGRPWPEAVIYELHLGTFTPGGTFLSAIDRLPHLVETGITAVEIMPVAQFSGNRGWGYDGVLPYAVHPAYGTPDDFKAFVDAAHGHGLMVLLDVVYNHFGPEGNYLGRYAPAFFHPERHTPWGAAIAYERPPVRSFFVENALYWLEEYHLDGLRLDAIDHVVDELSETELLVEIADRVRETITGREIHLTTEDNRNITRLHERGDDGSVVRYTAEWNDDFHNAAHVIATAESDGYYADFAEDHLGKFARSLAEGFAYQGEPSKHGGGAPRGVPSGHLPPTAFVDFLQNHDQTGNRAFGERLLDLSERATVQALTAILALSPHIPLLFMGEEYGETRPFAFFTDFHGELADAVRQGRRREFAAFIGFQGDERSLQDIPDPNAASTFEISSLDWAKLESDEGRAWHGFVRDLLSLRQREIVPMLADAPAHCGRVITAADGVLAIDWTLAGGVLELRANLSEARKPAPTFAGNPIHTLGVEAGEERGDTLPAHSVVFSISRGGPAGKDR